MSQSDASVERRVKEQSLRLLQRMQTRLDAAEARFAAPVAIVGMACRLPLGNTLDDVWDGLANSRNAVRVVPPERWAAGEGSVGFGGFLSDVSGFDATFFSISPREAAVMDPQQRLALEVAWEALEDGGIAADRLEGSRTGVYLGCCTADYARLIDPDTASADGYAATGGAPGVAAGRLAYTLGLNGPALVVDTACSSSLTALHLAIQALRAGECDMALSGGVNLTLLPQGAATLDQLRMLSPDGNCRAFDAGADGFVRGEGCGVVVLKRLSDARAAGDRVLAVIRGSAVNQDGRSAGLTAPNGPAQEAVIRAALANAGLGPEAVDYIEAHGTGTPLGDPIEMHALASVFAGRARDLLVGSVKTNIGHAEAAAGIAGLIKAVLMLRHQAVPPSLHFQRLNPHIDLAGVPITVPTTLTPRRLGCIGVSSFGFSGTNAHVVLERADTVVLERADDSAPHQPDTGLQHARPAAARHATAVPDHPVSAWPHQDRLARAASAQSALAPVATVAPEPRLFISAATRAALQSLITRYAALLAGGVPFADVCHSALTTRARLHWWVCVSSPQALAAAEPSDAQPPTLPPQPGHRVRLPLYPFERQRYWHDETARLPGRRLIQAGDTPLFEVELLPDAPMVADHRVRGARLVPAAFMLEHLRAAAQSTGQGDALRDISFDRPLTVASPRTLQVSAAAPLVLFARETGSWQRHATASPAAGAAAEQLDLPALQAACPDQIDPAAFARWMGEAGLEYGPFYDCVGDIARGPSQALLKLRAAPVVALLDATLRAAGAIAFGASGAARLPAGIAAYSRSPHLSGSAFWAHASLVDETAGLSIVDIRLMDSDGLTVARIDRLRLAAAGTAEVRRQVLHVTEWLPVPAPAEAFAAAMAAHAATHVPKTPAEQPIHEAVARLSAAIMPPTGPVRVLEFAAAGPSGVFRSILQTPRVLYVCQEIGRPFSEPPVPEQTFDLVFAANALDAASDPRATLDNLLSAMASDGRLVLLQPAPSPGTPRPPPDDWPALLRARGLDVEALAAPGHIVILARRSLPEHVHRDSGGPAATRCAALLATIQSLPPDIRRLVLLTTGAIGPAVTDPAGAALWGMMRTLRLERPDLEIRCIDEPTIPTRWAAERITAEPEVVLEYGQRLVPRLKSPPSPASAAASIDPDKWVLVTGAFGSLGRITVDWLVHRGARRLVLTGRAAADAPWTASLRAAGVEIRTEPCDLANPGDRIALISRLPALGGIVHAAGIIDDASLARAQPDQFAAVLRPKLDAALALDAAYPALDFFLLFSSAVSLFGQPGQASYVAANLGLDALAAGRRQRGQHAVSLGWGPWQDTGIAAGRETLIRRMANQGMGTIAQDTGVEVLDWAMTTVEAAVTVLPIDPTRFMASFAGARPPAAMRDWQMATPRGPAIVPAAVATGARDFAAAISAAAAAVLGYPPGRPIDPTANLFDLGLDSLMAVELRNRLQALVPDRILSSTLLFEHTSVSGLTAHLSGNTGQASISRRRAAADAPVAVVGMACRMPAGGHDPASFWQGLAAGRDGIIPRPPDRPDGTIADGAARLAGYLPDISGFDPTFFGIAPREAVFMDPQHRLLLEVTWEALEDALIPPDRLTGTPTGVFVGMCNYDYVQFSSAAEAADGYAGIGGAPSIAAGRIAYLLGLTGPAMVLDTACSSALVAIHLAVQALHRGECTLALAGGVNLTLGTGTTVALEQLHMLSPDGRCATFDAGANGFVRGEGCGMVTLKLLSDAQANGDRVLAVIRGSAVNQDGRSAGLTAPSGSAQEAVIRAALADGGIEPGAVDYIEAHGTGTALGDPIEMHALASVFGGRNRDLLVGSVKTNIGHTEAAAGVAGVVKAIQMLRHQAVPPNLHFRTLNPHIDTRGIPITVPTALQQRPLGAIGISSFGFSGTNAHLVLERAVPAATTTTGPQAARSAAAPADGGQSAHRLFISARTPQALQTLVKHYRALLAGGASFADMCHSAWIGRARMPWWVCADSPEALDMAVPSQAPPPDLPPQPGQRIDLPLYPFQRQPYWVQVRRRAPAPRGVHPLLGRRLRSGLAQIQYEALLAPDQPAWLADHAVQGQVVVPAAALVEMLLAATPGDGPVELVNITFRRMLIPGTQPLVQTVADPATSRLTIFAGTDADDEPVVPVATAEWRPVGTVPDAALDSARATAVRSVDVAALYARFPAAGLVYGPAFRKIAALSGGDGIAVAKLTATDNAFRLDPRVLDASWQSMAAALPPDSTIALMPVALDRLVWFGGDVGTSVVRLTAPDRADVALLDAGGQMVAWCEGLRLSSVGHTEAVLRETTWEPTATGEEITDWLDCRHETDPVAACWRVLEAYKAVGDIPNPPRLAVLAHPAAPVGGAMPHPAQAALIGLLATLAHERPELRPVLLDLDPAEIPGRLPAECGPLLAWRDGTLLAPRLESRPTPSAPVAPFRLANDGSGTLDGAFWSPSTRPAPGPGQVEIEIGAAGINFRDVMNLLGVYPGDGGAPGVECTGIITAVGPDAAGSSRSGPLAVGDMVVAIAPGCFASHVIADARLVCRLPTALDPNVAAAQPVALLTARLALEDVASLQPGQRVLIHAATGGVGLAAVALARKLGATIVGTAGSELKRDHLATLGVHEIHDSRSLGFAAAPSVDVVLNSLTGPAIPAGLRLLKPGGIFLELGKAELWSPQQVAALRPDIRYSVIGLDQMILDDPDRIGGMLRDVVTALASGASALPVQPYAFAEVVPALRCLQAARHIGKLVLSRTLLRGDACYVITGGSGALAQHLARWLAARGARHLVLLSRRPAAIEIAGAMVRGIAVDVTDRMALDAALRGLAMPVKGVFHLAGALHDATAMQLTHDQLDAAFAVKLRGAEALDAATASIPLDHFVLFGSLTGIVGSPGQANYAAANAALDSLMRARRARGAPALLIDWGAWQGEGMARGFSGPALTPEAALAALDAAMSAGLTRIAVSAGGTAVRPEVAALAERLATAIGTAKLDVLAETVDTIAGRILGMGELTLTRDRPLTELGLDSLMAVELRNALGSAVGRALPTSLVFDYPTAEALTAFIARELGLIAPPPPPPAISFALPVAAATDVEDLDEDDALLLLERKLSHAGY